jgi:HEAT repeat protein
MRKQLDKEILNARDIMFLPEYEIRFISKTGTPYEFRLDKKRYPINEIYAAASLSGKHGAEITQQQISLLKDRNDVVRYWAAIGLRSQNPEILKPFQQEIIEAMNDDYPPVAVTAAAISFQNFNSSMAENRLNEFIRTENPDIALMAVNYLLYLDNKEPFVESVKAVHEMPDRIYNVKAACVDFLGSLGLVPNNYSNRK